MNCFYKKGLDICNSKKMFEFIRGHFTYDTMNSWNGLRSIANNVKVYNLHLDGNEWNALALLEYDHYGYINYMIRCWEKQHPGYEVGFNGRSGGYLVLYNENNNSNILPDELTGDYEDFKEYCKEYYGGVKHYTDLRFYAELIRDFDKLCDELRDYTNELSLQDPVKTIVSDKLCLFNDEYNEELSAPLELLEDNRIVLTDEIRHRKSLLDCLINYLRDDHYKMNIKECNTFILIEAA